VASLNASEQGKTILKQARNAKGWTIDDPRWLVAASQILAGDRDWSSPETIELSIFATGVSLSTWKRFLRGLPIHSEVFKAFCQVLDVDWQAVIEFDFPSSVQLSEAPIVLEFPDGPVPLHSPFYVERPPIEALANQEIAQPGSFIRIQAPRKMGKSSLIIRILNQAQQLDYHTVSLDLRQVDDGVLTDLDKFLRWLCRNVSRQLQLKSQLDEVWDDEIGSKLCCTLYFQGYLLAQIKKPLVLVLNEVNRLFEVPPVAQEFLPLLRSWYEETKREASWQKLRLVVAHSTEVYVPLHIEQSPFNIGLPLKLPRFTSQQVQDLSQRHGLMLKEADLQRLVTMVGGHPYLLRLAFYYLSTGLIACDRLLQDAPTLSGIYSQHLQQLLLTLQKDPELARAADQVMRAETSVRLLPTVAYKLDNLGIVTLQGNEVVTSCDLYKLYLKEQLHL